jgi:hypothetical protein
MWKSRADKLPPAQFFADLIVHLRNLYPGARLDEKLARAMRDIWVAEWRAGQSAQDTAKATCSCDGTTIVPSAGAGRDLGKRLARPPKGAKRGDFVAPDELREVTPLAAARREAERYAQAFDRLRAVTLKLLQVKGWSAAKALRLQKLRTALGEIKAKHEAAVAKYETIRQSRREAKQPALYEKPLGAVGLTLRPDELPEPPPAKEKKPAKERKAPSGKTPPKEKEAPKQRKPQTAKQTQTGAAEGPQPTPEVRPGDCKCKQEAPSALPVLTPVVTAAPAAVKSVASTAPPPAQVAAPAAEKPKRGRKPKAIAAAAPAEPAKVALSESEAEELANLFAKASAEDEPS